MSDQEVIDDFHRLYYAPAHQSRYLGLPLWKSPTDMFIYQEIIEEVRPALIIECGTAFGASALFFANHMENAGIDGRVISIDIEEGDSFQGVKLPRHERITYLRGLSSTDPAVGHYIRNCRRPSDPEVGHTLVILDSDHSQAHVKAELAAYDELVTSGSYLVVEDVNVNGHPVFPEHGPGPFEAVAEWEPKHPEFKRVTPWDKYLFTFHVWFKRT